MQIQNNTVKKQFSFLEKFKFIYILGFYTLLIFSDLVKFLKTIFIKSQDIIKYGDFWLYVNIGLILIFMGIISIKNNNEKIAVSTLGVALILNPLGKYIDYQISLVLIIFLELGSLYFFWLASKIYNNKFKGHGGINKMKIFIILIVLLIPPILIWLFAFIQSRAQYSLILH